MYKIVMCSSNLPGDQYLVDKTFDNMGDAINYVQERYMEWGFVFTIHEYFGVNTCTYVHMVDSEQVNTMKDYKYMCNEPIYKETVRIYDEFKDALGIQEW